MSARPITIGVHVKDWVDDPRTGERLYFYHAEAHGETVSTRIVDGLHCSECGQRSDVLDSEGLCASCEIHSRGCDCLRCRADVPRLEEP